LYLGLDGWAALVAASSRGLGRAIATVLAAEGARVMVSGRDETSLTEAG
jgi:3-oxoacyl-[acyl-carrier protein] reductase